MDSRFEVTQSSIFYPPSSIFYPHFSILKPATRFELVSAAYETGALPIELRRHRSARCQLASLFY